MDLGEAGQVSVTITDAVKQWLQFQFDEEHDVSLGNSTSYQETGYWRLC